MFMSYDSLTNALTGTYLAYSKPWYYIKPLADTQARTYPDLICQLSMLNQSLTHVSSSVISDVIRHWTMLHQTLAHFSPVNYSHLIILTRATSTRAPGFQWREDSSEGLGCVVTIRTPISHNTTLDRRLGWAVTIYSPICASARSTYLIDTKIIDGDCSGDE